MPRTTADYVKGVVDVTEGIDLTPFIEFANELVTELCTDSGYTDDRLRMIETLLAAHFYCVYDPRTISEMAGSVQVQYESRVDTGLRVTKYGQQAILLDTAGNLAALDNAQKKKMSGRKGVTWLGTPHDEWPADPPASVEEP